ncbi:hypothetical protein COLO4_19799 [Corchorus olitorius]|uniref:Uncharacterized protein n=1 Tax=Corchorus olitorius TaxID=93759 RepID=A0A1R3J3C3_9ROSI|nr:hypothetical protein COLO4_19799 [Corchorus olitorius]
MVVPSSIEAMPCLVSTIYDLEIRSSTLRGFKPYYLSLPPVLT